VVTSLFRRLQVSDHASDRIATSRNTVLRDGHTFPQDNPPQPPPVFVPIISGPPTTPISPPSAPPAGAIPPSPPRRGLSTMAVVLIAVGVAVVLVCGSWP
jgi:hypothetical protein